MDPKGTSAKRCHELTAEEQQTEQQRERRLQLLLLEATDASLAASGHRGGTPSCSAASSSEPWPLADRMQRLLQAVADAMKAPAEVPDTGAPSSAVGHRDMATDF